MKKIIILITLVISTLTFSQEETDWKYIGYAKDGSEIYVKMERVDSYVNEAWVKMTNPVTSKKNKEW